MVQLGEINKVKILDIFCYVLWQISLWIYVLNFTASAFEYMFKFHNILRVWLKK